MLSRLLREILFTLIHLVMSVIAFSQNVYLRFYQKKSNIYENRITNNDIKLVLEYVPNMKKKPKHLVVLANCGDHLISDLARVVIWSLVVGVPYVSFYDITGELKENEEKFFLEVERNKKGIPGCIKWSKKPNLNGYSNGIQANTVVTNIFTKDDGRPKIAQSIRDIVEGKIPCTRSSKELTAQELNDSLLLIYPHIPEPDVVLYTGMHCCTYGLLPWHIRLTEFIQLSMDHSINVNSFIGAMYKYNKCDQRFGK